ncbi:MAG: HEAT repeat domain-containing protein, partial [Cyclobacteriaceae bacterium]|nr:HEAT repeat domain-containing protein [Cyclobacteriaceae bacterium]
ALDGSTHKYPNQGVIVRSNPDGSDFEVFAAGVRNTHEFVFDEYGNIISSDNDGDHRGESERLVHIVEGSDAGWRSNWQYGKYTDPKNNGYNVWMDERLYVPRWEGQAAYIIPPIRNYHNGPTGMVYNPGTALGEVWKNKFFLVEFVGNPARSHIWSFSLKPKGASFDFEDEVDVASGFLPTGIRFGPDGALYAADWVNGWGTKNYGRIWKIDVTGDKNDLKELREETKRLIQLDYSDQDNDQLFDLLFHSDMRVRSKAQFELAERAGESKAIFTKAISQRDHQLARVHGIWGLGQLASKEKELAESLVSLLNDADPEIVAQSAKVLGDIKYEKAGEQLIPLLTAENPRVKFFAAQALGRIKYPAAIDPLIAMIDANNDDDLYIRHAGVLALARIGKADPVIALANHTERDLRIAALLVLRRLQHEKVAVFLKDEDEYIVTEAARAINDDWSIEKALPALAEVLKEERFTSEPLLRRAINACLRVGGENELDILLAFANRTDIPSPIRAEALATIGTWSNPSVLDRVDGRYRGEIHRDKSMVIERVGNHVEKFLKSGDPEIIIATARMVGNLEINHYNASLVQTMAGNKNPDVRATMIKVLHMLGYTDMETVVRKGMNDPDETVRTAALGLIEALNVKGDDLPNMINPIFEKGSLREQQGLLRVLGQMPLEKSEKALSELINKAVGNSLSREVILDLTEAVETSKSEPLLKRLAEIPAKEGALAGYEGTLYGGNSWDGRRYFERNSTGQCVRCHSLNGQGGNVGPALDNIGD